MYNILERGFQIFTNYCVLGIESVGVLIIVYTAIKSVFLLIKHDEEIKLTLAEGIAMGLEFKLAGEVLRTTVVRDLGELMIVGSIIALRACMTFLLHWEIRNEEAKRGDLRHHTRVIKIEKKSSRGTAESE